ncbi:MAG: OmpA family protein [Ignavibacteria bacterium]|nr:OmpA family protein [Ignavibacteria bacterium]
MLRRMSLYLMTTLCCVVLWTHGPAQDNLRTQLFDETDKVLAEAKEKNAHLYAPRSFAQGMENYREAEEKFQRGKNIEDIREGLTRAASFFRKALNGVRVGEVTFSSVMAARADALSADGQKYSAETWKRAEDRFRSAAEQLEDGDMNDAKKEAGEAETLFRASELGAIQANYLSPARSLLVIAEQKDVRDNAPKTLARARKLSAEAEALLQQNRYDTDEARQLAQLAKYEAAHAIYLNETIKALKRDDREFEDVLLAAEEPLQQIANALDVHIEFDKGLEASTQDLLAAVKKQEQHVQQLSETSKRQEQEVANLRQQVASMEGRLGSLTETEKNLQQKLELQRQQEESVTEVDKMFSPGEGSVLRDGNNIVIRLYGLTFPVGKNIIEPQFFPLLSKVQEAIRKFPGCQVAVEGHTDSQGSDLTNQRLSESRAEAVEQYLKANMGSSIPVMSHGYGESRPVASNDNAEGRTKNRRIDIVIVPAWAIVGSK